jgi:S-formylglutathione hydrolase FrmB
MLSGLKKKILYCCLLLAFCRSAEAATVDTILVYSNAMHRDFKCVVVKPSSYKKKKNYFPVVYLLHGYGGWYSNWIIREPRLMEYADRYQLMIVCPDGGNSSWYFDSPVDSSMKYETYIGLEVPAFIDNHYRTIRDRHARAITGLSMGGHGALFLAFRHADLFGACGSMSGGVNLNSSHNKFDIIKRLGDTIRMADNWNKYSAINFMEHYPKDSLEITIDCGTKDIFYADNHVLHEKLLQLKIPHQYTERPGQHEWAYWRTSLPYHMVFFHEYFRKNNSLVTQHKNSVNH